MDYLFGAYWDIGKRNKNEDSLVAQKIVTSRGDVVLCAVADGIGGLPEGEVASGYLIEKIVEIMHNEGVELIKRGFGVEKIKRTYLKMLYEINNEFISYAGVKGISLGSTLALIIIYGGKYLIINIGDSSIYRFTRHRVKRLSFSHVNPDGSIYRCVGNHEFEDPFVRIGRVKKNMGFLLCSDGMVKKRKIRGEVFAPKDIDSEEVIERRLKEVARSVRDLGEEDNISGIYIKCQ